VDKLTHPVLFRRVVIRTHVLVHILFVLKS
jgi:hypothetical protein